VSVAEEIRKMEMRGRVSSIDVAAARSAVQRMSASDPGRLAAMNAMGNLERVARATASSFNPAVGDRIIGLFGAGMTPGQRSWVRLAATGSSALDAETGRSILQTFRGGMDSLNEEWIVQRMADADEQKRLRDEAEAHRKAWDTRGRKAKEAAEAAGGEAPAPKAKKAKGQPRVLPQHIIDHIKKADAEGGINGGIPPYVKNDDIVLNMKYEPGRQYAPGEARYVFRYASVHPVTKEIVRKQIYSKAHGTKATEEKFENLGPYMDRHEELVQFCVDKVRPNLLTTGKPKDVSYHADLTAVAVIALTGIRSGATKQGLTAGHFGCSQLKPEHVNIENGVAYLNFMGKGRKEGKKNLAEVHDPKIVAAIAHHWKQANKEKRDTLWPKGTTYKTIESRNKEMAAADWKGTLHSWRTLKASVVTRDHLVKHGNLALNSDPKVAREQISEVIKAAIKKGATAINDEDETARTTYIDPKVFVKYLGGLKGYKAAVHGAFDKGSTK